MKKLFAGAAAVAIAVTQMGTAAAAYSDVPSGAWYQAAVNAFTDAGYLDANQTRFRPGDNANRAEFIKLVVELNGGILSTAPAVPSFDDVKPGFWYYGYMEEAAKEGWVKGDNNCYGSHPCYARPAANINRAEAAALIVRAFGLEASGDAASFVDVPAGQWYTSAIMTAADHCVVQGDDATGRARPADNMNRAEMVSMLHRVDQGLSYGVDCGLGNVVSPSISSVTATSVSKVEVEFNTNVDATAAEMASKYKVTGDATISVSSASMINDSTVELTLASSTNAGDRYTLSVMDMETAGGDTFSDSMDFTGFSPIVQGDGTLEVALASTNPVGDTVPQGAIGVVLASLDLTASCDDSVVVQDVTVLHEGFGDESDIDGLYLLMDGGRISRKRTIDSQNQTSTLRLIEPMTIPACQTVTVDVAADLGTSLTAGSEHNIAVELPSDLQTNAKSVTGNFPLRGNTFRVAAVTSGQITVEYRSVTPSTMNVGDTKKVLGKFELGSNSTEDQTVYSITLEQNGSASDGDVTNLQVRRTDGTVLTNTVAATSGDFATFTFDPPFTILQGDKVVLEVVGDVAGGAGETVNFHFEEESDLFAVGSLYGFGVNGQLYGSRVSLPTTDNSAEVTIEAGEFTIEIDGPVQQKFTNDTNDAVLANVKMATGGDSVNIKEMYAVIQAFTSSGVGLAISGNTSYDEIREVLENVELRNTRTGQTVSAVRDTRSGSNATSNDSSTTTYQAYRFDDFDVDGTDTWELRADFIDNGSSAHPKSGDQFRVHICTQTTEDSTGCNIGSFISSTSTAYNMEIEGVSTGDNVTDVRPGGTISANTHRIASPTLNVAMQSIGSSDTAVKNSKNINLLRFQARAGEAEDVRVTTAVFETDAGTATDANNYTLWVDTDGDGNVETVVQNGESAESGKITFSDFNGGGYVVPAEQTVTFEVHADIASSLNGSSLLLTFASGATFVEAETADRGSALSGIKLNNASCTSCDITVTTTTSKLYTLVNQGDLFVSKDPSPVRSRQLLGGTLGDSVLRLKFRAQNEDIDVTDLQLSSSGSNASSIDRLELYKDGATSPFAIATAGGCGSDDVLTTNPGNGGAAISTFCANMENRQLVVPKGQDIAVTVRPRVKTDDQGATSGQDIALFITSQAVSNNTTGSGAVRARGDQSSNNLSANDADASAEGEVFIGVDSAAANAAVVGNVNEVVLAKITSIANANPDADNTNVPTGVSPFGQFRFTAATNANTLNGLNRATLSGVIFNVTATNVAITNGSFKFYNKADSSTKATCTGITSGGTTIATTYSGSLMVRCPALESTSVNTEIASGQSVTFVLEGDVSNSKISSGSTSTLQATIQDFTSKSNTNFGYNQSHIEWNDEDTAVTVFDWIEYPDTQVKSTSYKS